MLAIKSFGQHDESVIILAKEGRLCIKDPFERHLHEYRVVACVVASLGTRARIE